jgi:hypothetical protein
MPVVVETVVVAVVVLVVVLVVVGPVVVDVEVVDMVPVVELPDVVAPLPVVDPPVVTPGAPPSPPAPPSPKGAVSPWAHARSTTDNPGIKAKRLTGAPVRKEESIVHDRAFEYPLSMSFRRPTGAVGVPRASDQAPPGPGR